MRPRGSRPESHNTNDIIVYCPSRRKIVGDEALRADYSSVAQLSGQNRQAHLRKPRQPFTKTIYCILNSLQCNTPEKYLNIYSKQFKQFIYSI